MVATVGSYTYCDPSSPLANGGCLHEWRAIGVPHYPPDLALNRGDSAGPGRGTSLDRAARSPWLERDCRAGRRASAAGSTAHERVDLAVRPPRAATKRFNGLTSADSVEVDGAHAKVDFDDNWRAERGLPTN
jgi:hypothetical protein